MAAVVTREAIVHRQDVRKRAREQGIGVKIGRARHRPEILRDQSPGNPVRVMKARIVRDDKDAVVEEDIVGRVGVRGETQPHVN